ncbi:MAG TPA: MFS transporter [Gaiellaceae bacterium]
MRRLGLLGDRRLAALLAAETISTTGTEMTWLALPWFVLVTTGSPARMGFVVAAVVTGAALFGLPGGSVLAKIGARRTMLLADACRTPLVLAVPLLHWAGALSYPLLLGLVFAEGALAAPFFAAQRMIVPELLGEEEDVVGRANALLQGATRITLLLGPALAGVLIAWIGAASVLVIDAATFAASFLLVGLFLPSVAPAEQDDSARGVFAGLRYFARDPLLRAWGAMIVIVDASWIVLFTGIPVLVFEEYGRHAVTAGWMIGAFGAGALAGNVIAYRLLGRFDSLSWASWGLLAESLPLWVLVVRLPALAVAAALGTVGLVNGLVNPALHSILTLRAPAAVRAKAMTALLTLSQVGGPLALFAAGPAFGVWGARPVFAAVAAAQTLARAVAGTVGLRMRRATPAFAPS